MLCAEHCLDTFWTNWNVCLFGQINYHHMARNHTADARNIPSPPLRYILLLSPHEQIGQHALSIIKERVQVAHHCEVPPRLRWWSNPRWTFNVELFGLKSRYEKQARPYNHTLRPFQGSCLVVEILCRTESHEEEDGEKTLNLNFEISTRHEETQIECMCGITAPK